MVLRFARELRGVLAHEFLATIARPRHMLLTVAGFLIAATTLVGLLTIPSGLAQLAGHTGLDDVAMVLRGQNASEARGLNIAQKSAMIGNLPGVAHNAQGQALVAPQFVVNVTLRHHDGTRGDVMVRGVSPIFWQVVGDSVHISKGRVFKPGIHELIAGTDATRQFVALGTGAHVVIRQTPWKVTGKFTAGGSLWQSQLWTDIGSLQSQWNAPGRVTSLWVKLTSPDAFNAFAAALESNASLKGLRAERQRHYYRWQIGFIYRYARVAAWGIALVLGIAAILAISNALNMTFLARRRETAMLRAIGFGQPAVAMAMLIEVVVVGLVCSGTMVLVGWGVLNGRTITSATFFQSIGFSLTVNAATACWTLLYSTTLGTIAALWPVIRAVRAPLIGALNEK